ncbi:MAG TPA: hypothetical protein VMT89_11215, partial [Candidatus Acidoferrales bacterium]|nr:hypothetical protein [Candidatus Acidoferrales bacterium]
MSRVHKPAVRRCTTALSYIALAILMLAIHGVPAWAMYTPNPAGRWEEGHFFLAGDFGFIGDKDVSGGPIDDVASFYVRPGYSIARNVVVYARLGFQGADHVDTGFA